MLSKKHAFIGIAGLLVVTAGILAAVFLINRNNDAPPMALDIGSGIPSNLPEAKLTFYFEAQDRKIVREVLDAVEKKTLGKLNVKLDFKYFWDYPEVYLNNVRSIVAAGQPCDAFYYSSDIPKTLAALASEGDIKDLTDIFRKNAPNYYSLLSEEEKRSASVNGRIYAIPHYTNYAQIQSVLVRDDLMKKYSIPEIKNYEDYEVYLKAVKENEKGVTPMVVKDTTIGLFARANGYVVLDYQQGLVYKWDDPEMKIMAWEQTPEFKSGIEKINSWYNKDYLNKGTPIWNLDSTAIGSGKWASVISGYSDESSYNSALKNSGISWTYKAYPLYPDKPSERNSPMNGAICVAGKSNNAERVLMFINWLQSDQENYDSLMYGIKGKTYTLNDNLFRIPDGVMEEDKCYNWEWRWSFQNVKLEHYGSAEEKEASERYYDKVKTLSKYAPHIGFVPDYTSVKDITNRRATSFYTLDQSIYTGQFKQEDVDKYIQDQKDSGIENLVKEVQKQLDAWKAANSGS